MTFIPPVPVPAPTPGVTTGVSTHSTPRLGTFAASPSMWPMSSFRGGDSAFMAALNSGLFDSISSPFLGSASPFGTSLFGSTAAPPITLGAAATSGAAPSALVGDGVSSISLSLGTAVSPPARGDGDGGGDGAASDSRARCRDGSGAFAVAQDGAWGRRGRCGSRGVWEHIGGEALGSMWGALASR